ncbi:MAG: hypothetical protein GY816_12085 [Cytophagales bacterium]|nr:hypothetical protein [Cytophagales bacterium]
MNTVEIVYCLNSDYVLRDVSLGVFPANKIPKITKLPCCFVVNEDPSTKLGTHWVAFYIHADKQCSYFDSYGRKPTLFAKFTKKFNLEWNNKQIQSPFSRACGHHCIHFLFKMARGYKLVDIIELYTNDFDANDEAAFEFVHDTFEIPTTMYDAFCQKCRAHEEYFFN